MSRLNVKEIIKNLTEPGKTLSQRVIKGSFWVFLLRITNRLFGLVRLLVLARLLAPDDFGLMGIALLTMATLDMFTQTGFQQALIYKKDDVREYLDSAWTVLIIRGVILFTILYLTAPYVAMFFRAPEAEPIIRVIGISILLQAFTNIGMVYFQKELEFNKQFIYEFVGTIADFVVAVSAAFLLKNVWALVFGVLAGNVARLFMSYIIHPYRPRLTFNLEKAEELFNYGKWILGSSILIFLLTQGDDILVGRLLGAAALGLYQMAYRISNLPATEITHVISQVTFPAYAKLRDDVNKLRDAYLKVLQIVTFLSFPIAGLIFVLAPEFTQIFLGKKWMPMVSAMQVLSIFGVTRAVNATFGSLFQAIGRPNIITKISFAQLVMMAILIYPLTLNYGIVGTSIAIILPNGLTAIYLFREISNKLNLRLVSILKCLIVPVGGTLLTIIVLYTLKSFVIYNSLITFMGYTGIGGVVYITCITLFTQYFLHDISIIKDIKKFLKMALQ